MSSSSSQLYKQIRQQQQHQPLANCSSADATVDGQPYCPQLWVTVPPSSDDPPDPEHQGLFLLSIKTVVARIMLGFPPNYISWQTNMRMDEAWKDWTVTRISGGNTNQLFCVAGFSCCGMTAVLVRIFGGEMLDRDVETATYASLAHQGFALRYCGRFGNGRLEAYLPPPPSSSSSEAGGEEEGGWTTLTEPDLLVPKISRAIARQLARLHTTYRPPPTSTDSPAEEEAPTVWTQLYPWLAQAKRAHFRTPHDTARAATLLSTTNWQHEIDWLQHTVIGGRSSNSSNKNRRNRIGFCHNDLLASNIMMQMKKKKKNDDEDDEDDDDDGVTLQFIDYEYGGTNYYAYDIANHFNEYAGGTATVDQSTPQYDRRPTPQQQHDFLHSYVQEYNQTTTTTTTTRRTLLTVAEVAQEVHGLLLANHLVWGLWGLLQAAGEGCDGALDYLQYAQCRFAQYAIDKRTLLLDDTTTTTTTV